ncbi:MAG: DUF4886 domain-containing protein [Clostridia bacterium]|nr:DUF4886 domain-containing protein [Clostridia bacterium]
MKILAIGNSFSQDATRYLYSIARAGGVSLKVVNLYIGGCSLYRHYRNMLSGEDAYSYEINGMTSGLYVSLKKVLLSDEWDVVTLQQRSADSWKAESYEPYLSRLAAFVREHAPAAKLYIHRTWAYENGAKRLELIGAESAEQMLADLTRCYNWAAEQVSADGIIPSGDAMYRLHSELVKTERSAFRDGFHASLGLGRYLLGLVWYGTLCGGDILSNTFADLDKQSPPELLALAREIAHETVMEHLSREAFK